MAITQVEYDFLMGQEKAFDDLVSAIQLGPAPIQWTRELTSLHNKETFLLDFYKGSFELSRYTINKRYRQTVIMLRYDNAGRHTNPDGVFFEGKHVHLYREGYNDKFAFHVSEIGVSDTDPIETVFNKIMQFCNVKKISTIEVPMF
jgi:hypothetical protein